MNDCLFVWEKKQHTLWERFANKIKFTPTLISCKKKQRWITRETFFCFKPFCSLCFCFCFFFFVGFNSPQQEPHHEHECWQHKVRLMSKVKIKNSDSFCIHLTHTQNFTCACVYELDLLENSLWVKERLFVGCKAQHIAYHPEKALWKVSVSSLLLNSVQAAIERFECDRTRCIWTIVCTIFISVCKNKTTMLENLLEQTNKAREINAKAHRFCQQLNWMWRILKKPFIAKNEAKIQKKEKKRDVIVHSNLQETGNSDLINYFYRLAWAHEVCQLSHLINSLILAVLFVLQLT